MIIVDVIKSIGPIILLILIGFLLYQKKEIDDGFLPSVTYIVMNIALPASIFISVTTDLTVSELRELTLPLLIGAVAFAVNYALSFLIMKVLRIPRGRRGIFLNTIVNANTVFIGMPLNEALFGPNAVKYFLVYYVLNTISTWTIGSLLIAGDAKEEKSSGGTIHLKEILSPPILGFIAAIIVLLSGMKFPALATTTLTYLGNLVTPLSLIYIGAVLSKAGLQSIHFDRDTIAALLGKFILSPAIIVFVLYVATSFGTSLTPLLKQTLIVQAAVPALTILPILAAEAKGDVTYATNIVTTSTILFVLVIPFIMLLIS